MANSLNPTAANIISSLGIKGATASENLPGYVPVLGEDGRLDAKFIPANAASASLPPLSNVAYVDPYTDVASSDRKGSESAPFKSLYEAVSNFEPTSDAVSAKRVAFILSPGVYKETSAIRFPYGKTPYHVYIIGTGECRFTASTLVIRDFEEPEGGNRPSLFLHNILVSGALSVPDSDVDIKLFGTTRIGTLNAGEGSTLSIAPESRVDSTGIRKIFLADSYNVAYKSEPGSDTVTVGDELDRLGDRRIRIADITADDSGFHVGSDPVDVYASSYGSGGDVFDLSERDRVFAEGINNLFRNGKFTKVSAGSMSAGSIVADSIDVKELRMDAFALGGYRLEIDNFGYLVVVDGTDDPPRPPDTFVLIRDSVTGAVYVFGAAGGRLYIVDADAEYGSDSSDSSSSSYSPSVIDVLHVYDRDSGDEYNLYLENGRLVISQ